MSFFSKVMFKLYLNVFFFHDLHVLNVFLFSYSQEFCTKTYVRKQIWISIKFGKFLRKNESPNHPKASEKEKFHRNWNLHDIWRVSTRTKTIFRVSKSLCSKRWGHILKIIFFWLSKITPKKTFQTRRYLMILQHVKCA